VAAAGVAGPAANLVSTLSVAIGDARPGGPEKDTIIVYLSSHGVVNERNEPCLLADESQAHNTRTWLRMHDLLQAMIASRPAQARLVLLLDSGKLDHSWPMGIVYNTFAERLADLIEQNRAAYPRLVVINSNSLGQTCQLAPEIGGSAFGYFVAAALRGESAGNDGIITLAELHQYLQSTVDRFAREQRSTRQLPQILPSQPTDFALDHQIAHATGGRVPPVHPSDLAARQPTVSELWHRYDALLALAPEQREPVSWAILRRKLLRLDTLILAGAAYQDQLEWTVNEVHSLLAPFENRRVGERPELNSLAAIRQAGGFDADQLQQAKQQLDEWAQAAAQAEAGAALPPRPDLPHSVVAELVWQGALEGTPSRASMVERLRLLPGGDASREVDYREIQYLRLLSNGLDWTQANADAVARSLHMLDLAERAAAPADHRSLYWIGPPLAAADEAARRARDQLFVGTPEAIKKAEQIWDDPQTDYGRLVEMAQRVSRAYALRDAAWADGPYFVQWLLSSPAAAGNETLRLALIQLISNTHELARVLDDPPGESQDAQSLQQVESLATAVGQALRTLQDALQQSYRELWEEKGNDHETLEQIGLVLRLPLAPGDIRIRDDLWKRYFTQQFAAKSLATNGGEARTKVDNPSEDRLDWHAVFAVHPILQLLDRRSLEAGEMIPSVRLFQAPSAGDRSARERRALHMVQLAEMGGEVRARMRDVPRSAEQLAEVTTLGFAEESPSPTRLLRKGLSRADRLVRAACALMVASPWTQPEHDVSFQLRAVDDHHQLLSQSRRTLHDFWAATDPASRPYFAVVAEHLLTAARQCYRPAQHERDELQAAVAAEEFALQNWQPLAADNRSFTSEEAFVRHVVRWQTGTQIERGVASVWIEKLGGQSVSLMDATRTRTLSRRPVDTGEATELQHLILTEEGLSQSNALEAIAYYRGHERRVGFYLNAGADAAVAKYERPAEIRPRIWVRQDAVEKNNVIFILDCSRSMRYRHNFEGTEQHRLQIATGTLTTILQKLDPEMYRIGMLIYGNRSAWRREGNRIVLPAGQVHPAIDVEEALPLSPMLQADPRTGRRVDVRDDLYQILRQLNYRGDTPLYYSMTRGIQMLQSANPDGPRHIVVITDGVDSTYGNNEFPIPGFARTTAEDVKRELNGTGIKLHIVGFSAPPNHPQDRAEWEQRDKQVWEQQRAEIGGLATGGFHDVLSPERLERALMDSLQLKKFFVRQPGAAEPDLRQQVDLGRSWQIGVDEPLGRYQVVLAESPQINTILDAENGDWFELIYSPQRERLEHQRFKRELQNEATVNGYFIGSHLPARESANELSFLLSVQNADASRFSRRPEAVWAEFQPTLPTGTPPGTPPGNVTRPATFIGYDLEFGPKNPVPVLRFRVAGWPELADERAVARLWFAPAGSYRPTDVHELKLDRVSSFELAGARFNAEPRIGEVNESSRLLIDEEHSASSPAFPLHVQVDPPPDSAYHVFLPQSGRVQHVFSYQDRMPASLRLLVTSPAYLKKTWIDSGALPVELPNR
jgi:Mg-chelatase subunit ChlD